MQCAACKAANPEGQRYCGNCGAWLDPALAPLMAFFDARSREHVAAALQEELKNRKVVENELTETVIQKLSDWAKFYVGIPIAILLVALGFFGYEKLTDLNKLVDKAKEDITPKLKQVEKDTEDLKTNTQSLTTDTEAKGKKSLPSTKWRDRSSAE